ncbi:MAG: hypothetical protein ONB05_00410 [candidate division KSB1 bacterium]|nr:hypothetical protein [candidate division KSB1 bacterium]
MTAKELDGGDNMSFSNIISKEEIINEIDKIHPLDYLKVFAFLKRLQTHKPGSRNSSQALENLFSLEGCLSDIKMSSVELQKHVAEVWRRKYETH